MLMDINYFKDTFHLNLDNTTPLYQQLYDYFKRLILTGILKEGDQMLPEVSIKHQSIYGSKNNGDVD